MLTIAICDDEAGVAKELEAMTRACLGGREADLRIFPDKETVSRAVAVGLEPDVVLMDIVLPDGDGIELARELFPAGSMTQVIFVTGYMEYCTQVYETEHVWFIRKPVDLKILARAIDKARERVEAWRAQRLTGRADGTVRRIPLADVLYAEGSGRKVILHLADGERVEYYETLVRLESAAPRNFVRCHRSFLVNMDHVVRMEPGQFVLANGRRLAISRMRRVPVRDEFSAYLNGK